MALKMIIAENSLDKSDDVVPMEYEERTCADILSTAMLKPNSDDAKKFWNQNTPKNFSVQNGYQYTIGKNFPF